MSVYDEMAANFEAYAADSAYNAHYDRPAVLALAGVVRGLRVLDAGCGPGLYAEELLARGAELVALDASEPMLELARRRVGDRAEVLRANLEQPLPLPDCGFDLILSALAIHHVRNRTATLREFHRVLRPGGRVVLSTSHPTTDWLRKGGSYFDVCEEEDVWERDECSFRVPFWREPLTSLCAAIADAGFLIERLVEPLPAESMRERRPEVWEQLHREPGFLLLRLLKPTGETPEPGSA